MATLFCIVAIDVSAQDGGLEQIIVEKYYVSDENDTSVDDDGGPLPVGSVTYRVFVDMKPDYIFQAAYGEPGHELSIATSTSFFNNEDRGETFPGFGENRLDDNTVMLDSWLSVGGACDECIGVLKTNDDGVNTIENGDGVLQNADPSAGIPLTEQDGHIAGNPEFVTTVGISADIDIFNNTNDAAAPSIFSTTNGAWSSLSGSMGPDPNENIVLIGQFTTNGEFSFELNIQIRNETTIAVENYVAKDPVGDEIVIPSLIYPLISTSTEEIENKTELELVKIAPNPASDFLNIDLEFEASEQGDYEIYTLNGKLVQSGQMSYSQFSENTRQIDIRPLANTGLYLLKLNLGGLTNTKKFFKTNSN